MQHRRTKWVWTDRFSSDGWKWECFRTVECQQVESSRWKEQQQRKRDGPVRCVCEERRVSEHRICIAPLGPPEIQRRLMQHRRTKWVCIDGFSSGVWKWECFRTVECQQVESSRWMEQQQKKRDGPGRCVCEERRASEHQKSAEPEVVHGSVVYQHCHLWTY